MKRSLLQVFSTLGLAALVVTVLAGVQVAKAQVPSGVVVDSIAPATDWTNVFPYRAHHMVEDVNTGQMAFITGTGGVGANPVWLYSPDYGQTWSSLTGFLPTATAARVAVAADSNFTVYIAYRDDWTGSNQIGIFFAKDPTGTGQDLSTPIMVNDTTNESYTSVMGPNYPDIVVSPDGKNIIISAIRFNAMDTVWAYVSHDGGTTWKTHVIATINDPSLKPKAYNPGQIMWYDPSLAIQPNGYVSFMCDAQYDSTNSQDSYWEFATDSKDFGDTWSSAQWVTEPPLTEFNPNGSFFREGQTIALNNSPHFAMPMTLPGGEWEIVEFHEENGSWVYHPVTEVDPLTLSYARGDNATLATDAQGREYCFYTDKNLSAMPPGWTDARQVFVSGSSDDGDTWTQPVRLTGDQPFVLNGDSTAQGRPSLTQMPVVIPDNAAGIFLNGVYPGLYSGTAGQPNTISAWDEVQFPTSVVWSGPYDQDLNGPKAGGYAVAAKGASAYSWDEISTTGTKVAESQWYNGSAHDSSAERDDGTAGPFPIGFNFSFYGHSYSHFWVGANGLVSFTDSVLNTAATEPNGIDSLGYYDSGYSFPGKGNPFHTVISALYNDLVLGPAYGGGYGHGDIYYWTNAAADTCVIEWHNAADFLGDQNDTTITFEVVLASKDSSVSVMFNNLGKQVTGENVAAAAVVGIQSSPMVGVSYVNGSIPLTDVPKNGTGVKFSLGGVNAVNQRPSTVPLTYKVYQNYPNPFNPTTQIAYDIPQKSKVSVKVYNVLGEEVATLVNAEQSAGHHLVTFNGARFASGVYFYRVRAGNFVQTVKMVILK